MHIIFLSSLIPLPTLTEKIMTDLVSLTIEGGIATVTLNRPEKKNAFNDEMILQLGKAIENSNAGENCSCIVLRAEGNIFSAGLDLESANQDDPAGKLENIWKPVILSIVESKKLVVTEINGPAIGFGAAIALAGDIAFMAEEAFFQLPFADFGWVPDCGLTWMLYQQVGAKKAIEVILSGERYDGQSAATIGLVNHACKTDELTSNVSKFAKRLASLPPLAIQQAKKNLAFSIQNSIADTMSLEAQSQGRLFKTEDAAEAMQAFIEKRRPVFKGK